MKYSVIIPTYNNLESCLKPCLNSIMKNTPELCNGDFEIIVVSNGCTDGTDEYVRDLALNLTSVIDGNTPIKLLSYPDPLGYTKAVNTGLGVATGDYVILMNNDCVILDFAEPGAWIDMLVAPFIDPTVGITGPSKMYSEYCQDHFIIFFCCMIPRKLFFEIGFLDEIFNPGSGEDIDYCMRLKKSGYRLVRVPDDGTDWKYETSFPIYHVGEQTVHTMVDDWENKFNKRMQIVKDRTGRGYYSDFADVTCEISTKGRYLTTLPLAIMSVALQELKPKRLIILQDDPNEFDMREHSIYQNLFVLLESKGIQFDVIFGEGRGQVLNHQKALDMAETEWIWRLDDDNFAEFNVLRLLMEETEESTGAVAPSCVTPGQVLSGSSSTRMSDINAYNNVQWSLPSITDDKVIPAEHLYSTFVYRKSAANRYNENLSVVGHREETMFTYDIYRNGYSLKINRDAKVWHLRESSGGIRSFNDPLLWHRDEQIFRDYCKEHSIVLKESLVVNLDCGLGDHYLFKMALPRIRESRPDTLFKIACCHPEVFEDEDDVEVMSISEGYQMMPDFERINIYRYCMEHNWTRFMVDAYVSLYSKK